MRNTPRLYLAHPFAIGDMVKISSEQEHYLIHVMGLRHGHHVRIFNDTAGEYSAYINNAGHILVDKQLRPPMASMPWNAAICLLKPKRFTQALEGATQLGVSSIQPLTSQHCQLNQLNHERALKQIIESAEQSERLTVPALAPLRSINDFLRDQQGPIIVAAERHRSYWHEIMPKIDVYSKLSVLIGPEGGFAESELQTMRQLPNVHLLSLGENILRAETALIAILAQLQAISTISSRDVKN